LVYKENQVLEIDLQEMERKKVLVLRKIKFLDDRPSRVLERKKVLVLKENQVFPKKKESRPSGFTNNPKYFGKKSSE
jgi:hypothetical protein